jgi:hypothetical protein
VIIPAVAFIETAIDGMNAADPPTLLAFDAELKEFRALGDARRDALAAALPTDLSAIEGGYLLGLETARVLLSGLPAAVVNGVTL